MNAIHINVKKLLVLTLLIGLFVPAMGQWTFNGTNIYNSNSGNIGIGTTSPADQLEIVNSTRRIGFNTIISGINPGGLLSFSRPDDGLKIMYIGGAASPNDDGVLYLQGGGSELRLISGGFASSGIGFYINQAPATAFASTRPTPVMKIDGAGNVGIGSSSPDQKLTVNGTIHSKEILVDLNVPGPDYVFDNSYELPSLEMVQSFIEENKHLPEVPSANELQKNGIQLGEMNMLLLKKVEELTLYVIQQNKEIQELRAEIKKSLRNKPISNTAPIK